MKLNVTSEIGKLKTVLIHLPGREIDVMIPSMMEELLFDDILYGQLAREEHRRFQQIIWFVAEQVLDLQDLLEEVFEDAKVRNEVLKDFATRFRLKARTRDWLKEQRPSALAEALVGGIVPDTNGATRTTFELAPVPNLFFTRDPQVVLGDGVAISSMATEARLRESLLSRYVFRYHKGFRGRDIFWMDLYDEPWTKESSSGARPTIEGGDVLIARRDVLVVGLSERTNRAGVEYLANSLKKSKAGVKTMFVVAIPKQRSFMHLDTVFTIINRDECLIYPPVIDEKGAERAEVFEVDLSRKNLTYTRRKSLLSALKRKGMDLRPINCGGRRLIDQQREQWTDGANAFVLAPGIILLYERNLHTAGELDRQGYHIVYEDDLLLGRTELETWTPNKYAIQIQGHELSRARGGPRCMTMPLEREDI